MVAEFRNRVKVTGEDQALNSRVTYILVALSQSCPNLRSKSRRRNLLNVLKEHGQARSG